MFFSKKTTTTTTTSRTVTDKEDDTSMEIRVSVADTADIIREGLLKRKIVTEEQVAEGQVYYSLDASESRIVVTVEKKPAKAAPAKPTKSGEFLKSFFD